MTEKKATRLSKAAREFNVGISTIVEFLQKKGHDVDSNPNTKLDPELYVLLEDEYSTDLNVKKESEKLTMATFRDKQESVSDDEVVESAVEDQGEELLITDNTTAKKEEPKAAAANNKSSFRFAPYHQSSAHRLRDSLQATGRSRPRRSMASSSKQA